MGEKKQVLIVEDHTILREGLRSLLSGHIDFEIVGEATDGREAIRSVEKLQPDIVLMDISMPRMDGISAIREIKKQNSKIRILALTVHKTEEYILSTLEAGADGYLLKDATHAELIKAMEIISKGDRYLCPGIAGQIIDGYLQGRKSSKPLSVYETLTPREKEILKLIGEGYKNKEIAEQLFISVKTVEKHRSNLMEKLQLHNSAAVTSYAIKKGLISK
jgi:two-component system, NarL family, response regulator NreC